MLRTIALSTIALSVLTAAPAAADVLFTTSTIGSSARTSHYGTNGGGFRTFDNFLLPGNATVESVAWQAFWADFSSPTPAPAPTPDLTTWEVAFYADNGGAPGTLLSSHSFAPADVSSSFLGTGAFSVGTTYNVSFYTYSVALPASFAAAAGETYWLSILSVAPSFSPSFVWRGASGGVGDQSYQQTLGADLSVVTANAVARDRAFTLEGTVPEPASLLLFGLAAVGVAARRRRR